MATKIRSFEETPEEWLAKADDKILACRGQGHSWPKLRAGRTPKGLTARRQIDGCYQLTFICRDCGMERTMTTLPTGEIDFPAKYTYKAPEGYKTPKGSFITRRECLAEEWRRVLEESE